MIMSWGSSLGSGSLPRPSGDPLGAIGPSSGAQASMGRLIGSIGHRAQDCRGCACTPCPPETVACSGDAVRSGPCNPYLDARGLSK